jgi:hypothetical protein
MRWSQVLTVVDVRCGSESARVVTGANAAAEAVAR